MANKTPEQQEMDDRNARAGRFIDAAGKNIGAIGKVLSPSSELKDQSQGMATLGGAAARFMFKQGFGGGEIFPLLFALLAAPLIGTMAVAHHLTYYDFGIVTRRIQRMAALACPVWVWVFATIFPEGWNPILWAVAVAPPAVVILAFVVYVKRNHYPASLPAYPGEVFVAKILPIESRYVIYGLIAPSMECAINVVFGFVLSGMGASLIGGMLIALGVVQAALHMIGGAVGFGQAAIERRKEAQQSKAMEETQAIEAYKATGRVAGQAQAAFAVDSSMPDVDGAEFDEQTRTAYGQEEPIGAELAEAIEGLVTIINKFSRWIEDNPGVAYGEYFVEQGTRSGTPRRHGYAARLTDLHSTQPQNDRRDWPGFLRRYFTDEEVIRMFWADRPWPGGGKDPANTASNKITEAGALSVSEIYALTG
jgi:hypothetical protein